MTKERESSLFKKLEKLGIGVGVALIAIGALFGSAELVGAGALKTVLSKATRQALENDDN